MARYVIEENSKDEYYWIFKADNGEVISRSTDGYILKGDCKESIDIMKDEGSSAVVVDMTD
jgi:uncharacterized protein YegP (UPF0339 family)